jgi:hypothetical protein
VSDKPFEVVMVGQGAAGLAAALSAVEEARVRLPGHFADYAIHARSSQMSKVSP